MKFKIIAPVQIWKDRVRVLVVLLNSTSRTGNSYTLLFPAGHVPQPNEEIEISDSELKRRSFYPATPDQMDTAVRKLLLVNPMTTSLEERALDKEITAGVIQESATQLPGTVAEAKKMIQNLRSQSQKIVLDAQMRLSNGSTQK